MFRWKDEAAPSLWDCSAGTWGCLVLSARLPAMTLPHFTISWRQVRELLCGISEAFLKGCERSQNHCGWKKPPASLNLSCDWSCNSLNTSRDWHSKPLWAAFPWRNSFWYPTWHSLGLFPLSEDTGYRKYRRAQAREGGREGFCARWWAVIMLRACVSDYTCSTCTAQGWCLV